MTDPEPKDKVGLRIANGGAGQAGLIGAWADSFINYMVQRRRIEPFIVEWYLGDTTESIAFLESKVVDVAVTYNEAAERQLQEIGALSEWLYGWRDHFYLVGPKANPAKLDKEENVLSMIKKIVRTGNEHAIKPPKTGPPTRFLSRYDKSATNIKESELFIKIGQVPWAYAYSKWYHQYPRFPIQALEAAATLGEYTLSDRGIWLSSTDDVRSRLEIYKEGKDDEKDLLLNPAHVLIAKEENLLNVDLGKGFAEWVQMYDQKNKDGGQYVVEQFVGFAQATEPRIPLYTRAPPNWNPNKQ
ncbi:hypothetical protein P691DRAFT_818191 [Macrolepiota fuliginosa MF-IS2]|uniref:PBP domain-containing protein n=1 Tax=Macrolepiota fuliginosa MF-IS2 TaxID=1400762 RepID=A0A9P5XBP1_9AGAR|nr:hypothetical protein P691DRAFT_818191 [Macrolepiota fuliginosa MF-IS2]